MSQTRVIQHSAIGCLLMILILANRGRTTEFPQHCSISVKTKAIQPAGVPITLTVTLTNLGDKPIIYYGFADYPNAGWFVAQITDREGKIQKAKLSNDQSWNVSGIQKGIDKGKSVDIPAIIHGLPAGSYNIQIGDGKSARVRVNEDPEVARKWEEEQVGKVRNGDMFARYVVCTYLGGKNARKSMIEVLLMDLLSDNDILAERAADPLLCLSELPAGSATIITKAMIKHIELVKERGFAKTLILPNLAGLAATIGTDEALEPVLALSQTETARGASLMALSKFKQEKAAKQLQLFLEDKNDEIRFRAAQGLAQRKDPDALKVLLVVARDPKSRWRAYSFESLLKYRDDPRIERAIESALNDTDSFVRQSAEFALRQLPSTKKP